LLNVGGDLELYDVATLREKLPLDGHRSVVNFVAFTGDGKRLLTSSTADPEEVEPQELAAWDTTSWTHLQRTNLHTARWPNLGRVSPDQSVYLGKGGDDRFAIYDLAGGKLLARFEAVPKLPGRARGFFSPCGKFYLLDCLDEQGKAALALYAIPSGKRQGLLPPLPMRPVFEDLSPALAFSADERLVALFNRNDGKIYICDTETGKARQRLGPGSNGGEARGNRSFTANLALSADNKFLASWTSLDNGIRVWDVATGDELQRLAAEEPRGSQSLSELLAARVHLAWAPNGRVLAVGEKKVQLWELATGKVRHEWAGHKGAAIRALACSPDGRFLASGSHDTTVLIWDMSCRSRSAVNAPGPLASRWQALAAEDAATAFTAILDLAATPEKSVPWIHEHVKPAGSIAAGHIENLIVQLNDNRFQVRQKAMAELQRIGERAVPALDQALAGDPPLETRRRLQDLRKGLGSPVLKGQRLQAFRAIEVLERVGTPEARRVLQALAGGAPGALVTTQAQAALARVD
jgi:WD40 repeat protein